MFPRPPRGTPVVIALAVSTYCTAQNRLGSRDLMRFIAYTDQPLRFSVLGIFVSPASAWSLHSLRSTTGCPPTPLRSGGLPDQRGGPGTSTPTRGAEVAPVLAGLLFAGRHLVAAGTSGSGRNHVLAARHPLTGVRGRLKPGIVLAALIHPISTRTMTARCSLSWLPPCPTSQA